MRKFTDQNSTPLASGKDPIHKRPSRDARSLELKSQAQREGALHGREGALRGIARSESKSPTYIAPRVLSRCTNISEIKTRA